jgi:aminoglycoside 6'-N-acetyltransferase
MSRYESPHPGDHEPIEGPGHVSLRPIAPSDLPELLRWLSEPEVVEFWGPPPQSIEDIREYVEPDDLSPTWRLIIEERGTPLGLIQYWHQYPDTDSSWTAGIDILLGEPGARNRGVGVEAIRILLRYLFEVKQLRRVTIDPEPRNSRAIRAYEKVGFRFDGVLRRHYREHGQFADAYWMSLLDDEWPAARARWEADRAASLPLPEGDV